MLNCLFPAICSQMHWFVPKDKPSSWSFDVVKFVNPKQSLIPHGHDRNWPLYTWSCKGTARSLWIASPRFGKAPKDKFSLLAKNGWMTTPGDAEARRDPPVVEWGITSVVTWELRLICFIVYKKN
jgi:hypothetical protein